MATSPANISTDIGKLIEEEMIFLLPWDVPTPLPLALPGEDTRRGTCATAAAHLSQENAGQQQGVMLL